MNVCGRGECHTTAGCANRGPNGELCYWPNSGSVYSNPGWLLKVGQLTDFTDDEIAREYYRRALAKLGDPRVAVGLPIRDVIR